MAHVQVKLKRYDRVPKQGQREYRGSRRRFAEALEENYPHGACLKMDIVVVFCFFLSENYSLDH